MNMLDGLEKRAAFELPEDPTADNVASISKDWRSVNMAADEEWAREFSFDFSSFKPYQPKEKQSERS